MSAAKEQHVRLFDGWHFKLTDDQIEQIGEALAEIENPIHQGEAGLIAQVWQCVDGTFCCVHLLTRPMAHAIKATLLADKIVTVRVEGGPHGSEA